MCILQISIHPQFLNNSTVSDHEQQGKRDRSKSTTKSPDSRSPPNMKTVEGDGRKEDGSKKEDSEEKRSDKDSTSPFTRGLLKRPDLGKVSVSRPAPKPRRRQTTPTTWKTATTRPSSGKLPALCTFSNNKYI